jgi:hypothetical protein
MHLRVKQDGAQAGEYSSIRELGQQDGEGAYFCYNEEDYISDT